MPQRTDEEIVAIWEQKLDGLTDALEDLGFIVGVTIIDRDDGLGPLMINVITGHDQKSVEGSAVSVAVALGVEEDMMLRRGSELEESAETP